MPCGSWLHHYCLARTASPQSLRHFRALATLVAGAFSYALQPPLAPYNSSLPQQQCRNSAPFLFRYRRKYSYLKATLNARCRIKCPYSTSNRRKREEAHKQKTRRLADRQPKNTKPREAYDSIKREERTKQHRQCRSKQRTRSSSCCFYGCSNESNRRRDI